MLKGNLTCAVIGKLLTHYVEDNLDDKCKNMVSIHLRNCPPCMEKYAVVKKLFMEAEKKRKLIKKPDYDDNLVKTMKMKKILNNSFYKTKYNLKTDITAKVMENLKKSRGILNAVKNIFRYFFQH